MHYAEFAEDEVRFAIVRDASTRQGAAAYHHHSQSQALMSAIKEYENNKWKVIGQKVGKPAKVCSHTDWKLDTSRR
jgi:hypothetical protein